MSGTADLTSPEPHYLGEPPELAWVPVARCVIDPSYQRTLETRRSQDRVAAMAQNFRWEACGAITAARTPDGDFAVIDGQHRVAAARLRAEKGWGAIAELPAIVYGHISVQEQAAAFVRANTDRVALTNLAIYHAKIVAGDPEATAIAAIVKAAGMTVPRSQPQLAALKPGETLAIGTFGIMWRRHGEALTRLAVGTVAEAWAAHGGCLRAAIFRSVGLILARAAEGTRRDVAAKIGAFLGKIGPERFALEVAQQKVKTAKLSDTAAHERVLLQGLPPIPAKPVNDKVPAKPVKVREPATAKPNRNPPRPRARAAGADPTRAAADRAAIERHLAQKGATRPREELTVDTVMNAIRSHGPIVVPTGQNFRFFTIDAAKVDRDGLVARANRYRQRAGLKPWTVGAVAWKRPEPPPNPHDPRNAKGHKRPLAPVA